LPLRQPAYYDAFVHPMADRPDILREYRVRIIPAERAGPQPRYPANLGRRTKFGGVPDAIQPEADLVKRCPKCHSPMHFVAQLDSFEFNGDNNPNRRDYGGEHFMFGDVGMIYVWFCFHCLTPHASLECY
jgi:hypothetical protein